MTPRTLCRAAGAIVTLGAFAAFAVPLDAQIIDVPMPGDVGRPVTISASFGFLTSAARDDGATQTRWFLGEAIQYKASVDVGLRAGALGLTGSIATQPMQRSGLGVTPGSTGHIQLRQLLATFRTRDQLGAHQVLEVSAGLAQWGGYSGNDAVTDDDVARNAFALIVGYGFGFSLGDRASLTVVQELSTLWGPGEGLAANQSRQMQLYTTRLGLRYMIRGSR